MLKGEHQIPDIAAVIMVYAIIFSEYYAFIFVFLPGFNEKYGYISYVVGFEFTIFFIFLNLSYIMIQHTKPGYPPKDLVLTLFLLKAKHYHDQTLEEIKLRTKKMTEKISKHRQKQSQKYLQLKEEDEEIIVIINYYDMVLATLFKHYNQCHIASSVRISNYPELIIAKNVINVFYEWQQQFNFQDHHCPWVNNCVGLKNHRYFCQFNFYAILCMIQCTIFITYDLFIADKAIYNDLTKNQQFGLTICATTCFALVVVMGFLLGFHLYHIALNITTVEYHVEEIKVNNPFKKPRTIDNFKEVFGAEMKYWFLPLLNVEKTSFPRSDLFEV